MERILGGRAWTRKGAIHGELEFRGPSILFPRLEKQKGKRWDPTDWILGDRELR